MKSFRSQIKTIARQVGKTLLSARGQMGDKEGQYEQDVLFNLPLGDGTPHEFAAQEWKVVCLRECPLPDDMASFDQPKKAVEYWQRHIARHPYFNADVECLVALLLNSRSKIIAHHFISTGTLNSILVHPREVFRAAIIGNANAVVLMHNHPSGDPTPSEADAQVTRELSRAAAIVQIQLADHIIVGRPSRSHRKGYVSLRELGLV